MFLNSNWMKEKIECAHLWRNGDYSFENLHFIKLITRMRKVKRVTKGH